MRSAFRGDGARGGRKRRRFSRGLQSAKGEIGGDRGLGGGGGGQRRGLGVN